MNFHELNPYLAVVEFESLTLFYLQRRRFFQKTEFHYFDWFDARMGGSVLFGQNPQVFDLNCFDRNKAESYMMANSKQDSVLDELELHLPIGLSMRSWYCDPKWSPRVNFMRSMIISYGSIIMEFNFERFVIHLNSISLLPTTPGLVKRKLVTSWSEIGPMFNVIAQNIQYTTYFDRDETSLISFCCFYNW